LNPKPLFSDFERFTSYIWELRKKQVVTTQSLEKIEDGKRIQNCLFRFEAHTRSPWPRALSLSHTPAAYTIVVRSSEYDLSPEMLDDIVARTISNFEGRLNRCDYKEDEEEC